MNLVESLKKELEGGEEIWHLMGEDPCPNCDEFQLMASIDLDAWGVQSIHLYCKDCGYVA